MDIENLIEEGARVVERATYDAFPFGDTSYRRAAKALVAMTLKAIVSEEANITTGDILLACGEMTAQELRTVKAVLSWRLSNIRALAEQVEKDNG